MQPTLRDIARMAGVSIKTVSRVVNHQGEISVATRARVQAMIDECGYQPNRVARSLVHRRTNIIGVVTARLDDFGPQQWFIGIQQGCTEYDYSVLLIGMTSPEDSDTSPVLDMLLAHRVDGIVWAVPEIDDNRSWIKTRRMDMLPPIVFLKEAIEELPGVNVVAIDNYAGAKEVTQHLLAMGHGKVAIIAGSLGWCSARERFQGWHDALIASGLEPDETLVFEGDWSAKSGAQAMYTLLERHPDLDAVCVCNDQMALGALQVLQSIGRRVPDDVAVVGFDDIPEAAYFWPSLTTVSLPHAEYGRQAVQFLHCLIEMEQNGEQSALPGPIVLKPRLVIRSSS